MKAFYTVLVLTALAFQSVKADWVIIQKTNTEGKEQEVVTKVKGDKARSDVADQASVIIDGTTSETTVLMHQQKALMKMNAEAMKGIMALAGNLLGGKDKKPRKPEPTGQKEKVGAYDTEIYLWKSSLGQGKFWIAKDFPQAAELNAIQDRISKAMGNPAAALAPSAADFPGMVIKSEVEVMGKKAVGELVSVTEQPLDDSIFVIPADYQELKLPKIPGGGK